MSKGKLSELEVKNASCPALRSTFDVIDGNGLILRVTPKGVKTWRYRYTMKGVVKILKVGTYPETSLKAARKERDRLSFLKKAGLDPSTLQIAVPPHVPEEPTEQLQVTFKDVVDEYLKTLAQKPSYREVKRAMYNDFVSVWGSRDPEGISLRESVLLLDKIKKRAPVLSGRLYAYLKRAYTVSIQRGLITVNPLINLQKPAPEAEIRNNAEKVLTHEHLQILARFTRQSEVMMMDDALMMILWTGARPSEVLNMQWTQIEADQWTLGPREHKGGHKYPRSITRPLNAAAMQILRKYEGLNQQYVFPGKFGTPSSHIRLSRHVRDVRKCYGIKEFTPNHLRHTISTRMREIGIRPDIVERIIGHHVDSGIIGVYSSYNWLPEMRDALEKWQKWIAG